MARSGDTGIISGIPTETSPMTNYTVFANNSQTGVMFNFSMAVPLADTDDDGLPDGPSVTGLEVDEDDDGDGLLDELEVKCGSSPSDSTMSLRLMKTVSVLLRIPPPTRMMIQDSVTGYAAYHYCYCYYCYSSSAVERKIMMTLSLEHYCKA